MRYKKSPGSFLPGLSRLIINQFALYAVPGLCFTENVLDNGLSCLWIVTDCVSSLPAAILALSDIAFSVCSSLWHILSPSFVTVHDTAKDREKLLEGRSIIRKLSILGYRLSLFKAYQYLSRYGDFRRLQRYKAYRFSIKAPPQTVVTRGFAATFLKFSVKPFWEPRKKRQFPKPVNPCGSSHCGLL